MKKLFCSILSIIMLLSSFPTVLAEDGDVVTNASVTAGSAVTDNARESTFDYPMLGDPNYISDEEFFTFFNYERYPEMAAVKAAADEAAAGDGDYTEAKEELVKYYKSVREERRFDTRPVNRQRLLYAHLLNNNVSVPDMTWLYDVIRIDHEWREYAIDISVMMNSYLGQNMAILLESVNRNSVAEFMTKEGGYTSYVIANINGKMERIDIAKDTYFSGGRNANTNYGDKEHMLVASNSVDAYVYDENYRYGCMVFDLSRFKQEDELKSATLYIKGRISPGSGEIGKKKEIILEKTSDLSWKENEAVWSDCKPYALNMNDQDYWNYKYSAYTDIPMYLSEHIIGRNIVNSAMLWDAIGGEQGEQYAYTFLRQLMAQIHTGYYLPVMRHLERAVWLDYVSRGLLQTITSQFMTPEIFCAILKQLYIVCNNMRDEGFREQINSNAAYYKTGGVYTTITRFRELNTYDQWLAELRAENTRVFKIAIRDDMSNIEKSSGYYATLASAIMTLVDTYRSVKTEDFPFDEEGLEVLEMLNRGFCYSTAPGMRGFNDGDEVNNYQTTYTHQPNAYYRSVLGHVPELEYFSYYGQERGFAPDFTSMSFPTGLYTVFRSDWSKDAIALKIDAKGTGTSHKHYDQLSVSMWGYDQFLITDQGVSSYAIQSQELQDMKNADHHSMVVMNGKNLDKRDYGEESKELASEINNLYDFASYASPFCIDAQTQNRSVLYDRTRKLFVISDYIKPKSEVPNDYAQYWNMLPDANMTMDAETGVARSNFGGANVSVTPVAPEEFTKAQLEHVHFSTGSTALVDAQKAAYHKRVTGDVTFDTVIVPENIGERFSVEPSKIDTGLPQGAINAFYFDLYNNVTGMKNTAFYYNLNDFSLKGTPITLNKYTTDATTMYIVENADGKLDSVMLLNASYLKDASLKDKYVFKAEGPINSIAFRINGQTLEAYSSKLDEDSENALEDMSFYGYGKVKGTFLNGVTYDTKLSDGGYLYYGEDTLVEEAPTEPETPGGNEGSNKPSGGSGGGGGGSAHGGGGGSSNPGISAKPEVKDEIKETKPENENKLLEEIAKELKEHWAEKEISELYKAGIVKGDNGLRLSDDITRAEFVALIVRALDIKADGNAEFSDVFSDDWYAEVISAATEKGLVQGSDGKFRPNDSITREEMCKILLSAYVLKNGEKEFSESSKIFADDGDISEWAREYVYRAEALSLVKGMGENSFNPKGKALREQAFTVLWRLLNV